jgi:hypothetical protein
MVRLEYKTETSRNNERYFLVRRSEKREHSIFHGLLLKAKMGKDRWKKKESKHKMIKGACTKPQDFKQ